jgi:hypothetical protein
MDLTPPGSHRHHDLGGARSVEPGDPALVQESEEIPAWLEEEDLEAHDDLDPDAWLALAPEAEADHATASAGTELAIPENWDRDHQLHSASHRRDMARDRARFEQMRLEALRDRRDTWTTTVSPDLFTYGYQVLPSKIRLGTIFSMMAQVKGPRAADLALPDGGPEMTAEEAQDMASDVVIWALKTFHELLMKHWDPTKEATFRTYFVGRCCHGFAGVYRRWLRSRRGMGLGGLDNLTDAQEPVARDKPHTAAIVRLEFEHFLDGADDNLERFIAVADTLEFPDRMIAEMVGHTEKVIEYRLAKLRKRAGSVDVDRALGHLLEGADDLRVNRSRVA